MNESQLQETVTTYWFATARFPRFCVDGVFHGAVEKIHSGKAPSGLIAALHRGSMFVDWFGIVWLSFLCCLLAMTESCDSDSGERLLYTGPVVNAEMLILMLEKHGIVGRQAWVSEEVGELDDEFSRPAHVYVPEADYPKAYELFFTDREDEL